MAERDLPRNFHSDEYGGVSAPLPWVLLPAYTVLPFLRSPIGLQLVHPWTVIRRTLGLILAAWLLGTFLPAFTPPAQRKDMGETLLVGFTLAYLMVALVIFARRWQGQRKGEEMHSGEAGYSWLVQRTKLPVFLSEQVIVPLAIGALGYLLAHTISVELGWWLMAAGVSLFIMARWESRRVWSQHQATVDDLIRAKTYEDRMERHETQTGSAHASPDTPVFADLGDDAAPSRRRSGVR
jgi:hypothetical protein